MPSQKVACFVHPVWRYRLFAHSVDADAFFNSLETARSLSLSAIAHHLVFALLR
jgi:hypothetical protein